MSTLAQSARTDIQRPRLITALAAGAGFAVVFTALGSFNVFNGERESFDGQGIINWAVAIAAITVAALVCWRTSTGAVARNDYLALARRALIFGLLTAVSIPVFWLGIFGPFAAGSMLMGGITLSSGAGSGAKVMAGAGLVLAVLGTVACVLGNLTA